VADEMAASYTRIEEIEAKSASRLLETEEAGTSTVVAAMSFERSRSGRPPGERLAAGEQ